MSPVLLDRYFSSAEWEAICSRCGACCREKYEFEGRIIFTEEPCAYLGPDKRCTIYERRLELCPDCHEVSPKVVLGKALLPPTCAYVQLANSLIASQSDRLDRWTRKARKRLRKERWALRAR